MRLVERGFEIDGERLAALRRERYLTQRELAERSSIGKITISDIERGERVRVAAQTIKALADALDVEPEELSPEHS